MRESRLSVAIVAALCAVVMLVPVSAGADEPPILVEDGLTQPIYAFDDAIEQRLWVETPLDTDGDGELDRVVIDVSRPEETDTAGIRVPVIMEASPYRSGTWGSVPYHQDYKLIEELPQSVFVHADDLLASAEESRTGPNLPGSLDNYYVPRGYAVVVAQSVGTAQSDGCPTVGGQEEALSAMAIIDWLNGRATAYDVDGNEVDAYWTTGDVGMTGVSYNGSIPNMVAASGIDGLETIVPVAAISNWYNYYRENGLVVAPSPYQGEDADVLFGYIAGQDRATGDCADEMAAMTAAQDRISGDYNEFWQARNYVDKADRVTASVFVVHGRNDWNVKPGQYGQWWDALTDADVTRKIWLHNRGHGSPSGSTSGYTLPDGTSWNYQTTMHRWFDHELWGVDNGILDEPTAIVQREDNSTVTYDDWPQPGSEMVRMSLTAETADGSGGLQLGAVRPRSQPAQTFVDHGKELGSTQDTAAGPQLIAAPDDATGYRLVYVTEPLEEAATLSGTPEVTLRASINNRSAANLTAYLVDYGPDGTQEVVTRGWMDVQNRFRIDRTDPIAQGRFYDFSFDLHPDDHVFAAGHRMGLVVFSSDSGNRNSSNSNNWGFTLLPNPGTEITVLPGSSSLELPLVGGAGAID